VTELKNERRTERGTVTALVWGAQKVKNRREHVVPLEGRPQTIVRELWKGHRPGCGLFHLDGRPMGDLRKEWRRACRAAGFPVRRKAGGLVFHDTRRCTSTTFAAAGVPDVVARSITDHRTASMHMRYSITQESAAGSARGRGPLGRSGAGLDDRTPGHRLDTRGGTDDLALQLDPEKARKYKPPSLSRV
jgi:integrase